MVGASCDSLQKTSSQYYFKLRSFYFFKQGGNTFWIRKFGWRTETSTRPVAQSWNPFFSRLIAP